MTDAACKRPDPADDDVRRRYYRITPRGRRIATEEIARLASLVRRARASGLVPKTSWQSMHPLDRVYRVLLRLYPAEFRDEDARERDAGEQSRHHDERRRVARRDAVDKTCDGAPKDQRSDE